MFSTSSINWLEATSNQVFPTRLSVPRWQRPCLILLCISQRAYSIFTMIGVLLIGLVNSNCFDNLGMFNCQGFQHIYGYTPGGWYRKGKEDKWNTWFHNPLAYTENEETLGPIWQSQDIPFWAFKIPNSCVRPSGGNRHNIPFLPLHPSSIPSKPQHFYFFIRYTS